MMRRNKKPPVRLEGAALIVVLMALAVLFSVIFSKHLPMD